MKFYDEQLRKLQEQIARNQIETVLSRLRGMQRTVEQERVQLQSKLDTLVRDAKLESVVSS